MIKLIIFDIGGVLLDFTETDYISYIADKLKIDATELARFILPLLDRMELGRMTQLELESRVRRRFKLNHSSLEWDGAFKKIARPDRGTIRILRRLAHHYGIVLLTNISISRYTITIEELLRNLPHERTFASCYLKMRKPDPRIYRRVLSEMRIRPSEAIFIDNMLENVQGAEKVGIKSIHFRNSELLLHDLKRLHLKGI